MSRLQRAQTQGEIRLWRAILLATEADLRAAFARGDRKTVQRLGREAQGLRLLISDLSQQGSLAS